MSRVPITRIEYDRYGGPELMHLAQGWIDDPRDAQVRVRVHAASINPIDWKLRKGEMKLMLGRKFPRAIGSDFVGTVESVGPDVTRFKVGDAVVGTTPFKTAGGFASMTVTDEKLLVVKPHPLSFQAAAVLPIPAVTAWAALIHSGRLASGQRVFINGALGSVGRSAIAIAQSLGARVSGTVGASKVAEAKALGLETALDYHRPIPDTLNDSFDLVFDSHGGLSATAAKALLRRGERSLIST